MGMGTNAWATAIGASNLAALKAATQVDTSAWAKAVGVTSLAAMKVATQVDTSAWATAIGASNLAPLKAATQVDTSAWAQAIRAASLSLSKAVAVMDANVLAKAIGASGLAVSAALTNINTEAWTTGAGLAAVGVARALASIDADAWTAATGVGDGMWKQVLANRPFPRDLVQGELARTLDAATSPLDLVATAVTAASSTEVAESDAENMARKAMTVFVVLLLWAVYLKSPELQSLFGYLAFPLFMIPLVWNALKSQQEQD